MNTFANSKTESTTAFSPVTNYLSVLKNFRDFNGRARRKEYWYFVLANTIVSFLVGFIDGLLFNGALFLNVFYTLAIIVPYVALCVRRMHDVDKSGWYALIPIYNFILAITEGTRGRNQYGNDPKATELSSMTQPVA
ncbi:DUF805 domain-containing protein [Fibrisoma montanum]|uniref:DUF805 domain-containing protein n=1 Tax=Fibrisoma montanum TaxID=2305895 RepID=A0A418MBN8_9BACT|nr:DUF805 domain-containing protein [Fibrisoma montanum]RIV23785.1 DUF805 domain-containing protein [Fibrisoma montanum]